MSDEAKGKMMTEELLATEVYLAAPLALKEHRKRRGWSDAVYYLQLKGKPMVVLRPTEDGQALDAFYFDMNTCRVNTPSLGRFIRASSVGKSIALNISGFSPSIMSYPVIEAVFVCSRELETIAEVKGLRNAKKKVTFNLTSYNELTEVTLSRAPDGTWFYGTIRGQVFQFTLVHDFRGPYIKVEEMFVYTEVDKVKGKRQPSRVMYLTQGFGPSKERRSRRKSTDGKTASPIGPFDQLISSDKSMSANEVRDQLHIAGRHQTQPRKSPAAR